MEVWIKKRAFSTFLNSTTMDEETSRLLMEISRYSAIAAAVVALYRFRSANHAQWYLCWLIFLAVGVEFLAYFLASNKIPNLPLLHVFTVFEFGLIAYMFQPSIEKYISKTKLLIIIFVFAIAAVFNSVFHESIYQFNPFARSAEALLLLLLSLLYFYATLTSMTEKHLERSPIFWISAGCLLYFSSSLFIFIYSNVLFGVHRNSFTIWGLHALMSILHYIFYTIALWVKPKT